MKNRKAFIMSVNAGAEEEYEERHNPIWPDLEKVLKDYGVSNYSIFLHAETRHLFGYAVIKSEEQWAFIASTDICHKWWKHRGEVIPSNPDHSLFSAPLRDLDH
jgi:L-rhamnose mutarotase